MLDGAPPATPSEALRSLLRPFVTGPERIQMDTDLVQLLRPRARRNATSSTDLVTCSLCLRVLRESEWVDAERVIRKIHSYDLEELPHLLPGLCDDCADRILTRRATHAEAVAA